MHHYGVLAIILVAVGSLATLIRKWWQKKMLDELLNQPIPTYGSHKEAYKAMGMKEYTIDDEYGKRTYWAP